MGRCKLTASPGQREIHSISPDLFAQTAISAAGERVPGGPSEMPREVAMISYARRCAPDRVEIGKWRTDTKHASDAFPLLSLSAALDFSSIDELDFYAPRQ